MGIHHLRLGLVGARELEVVEVEGGAAEVLVRLLPMRRCRLPRRRS